MWTHQAEAAAAAHAGEHVVVSTGTASGKSVAFLLPVLSSVHGGVMAANGRGTTALYLAPTKALAHDQLAWLESLDLPELRAATLDGDTEPEQRRWVRKHAAYVLTNPDLLHHSLLPNHERWAPFWRALRFVVIDECHVFRGVFGAHVAHVLRRLRRVAAHYRATPTFMLASATVADPAGHAGRLIGMPVRAVTDDGSPRGELTLGLWEAPASAGATSAVTEAGVLMADLTSRGMQTVAFARSRTGAETVAAVARDRLDDAESERIAAYRGGFLPEERRHLEHGLRAGRIRGLATTTALELGIDISGLDAVVVVGWPGTVGSFWQMVGRAGRGGRPALAVLVGADDPLDAYLLGHPEAILGSSLEGAVLDIRNPLVVEQQYPCAAAELAIRSEELADGSVFGQEARAIVDGLTRTRVLRRRPDGWYWPRLQRPTDTVTLRGAGQTLRIVDAGTGRVLGTVEWERADRIVFPGAVYVHQGEPHVVTQLDEDSLAVVVTPGDPGWTTHPRSVGSCTIGAPTRPPVWRHGVGLAVSEVTVTNRVVSFLRRRSDGVVLGEHRLDLPERSVDTVGVRLTFAQSAVNAAELTPARLAGALHALEHLSLGLLPLVATADRRDIGSTWSTAHPDTGLPTVVIFDNYPGGAGFAERGFDSAASWLAAARDTVTSCPCSDGCPACVQSASCSSGNQPLDKTGAASLLTVACRALHQQGPS